MTVPMTRSAVPSTESWPVVQEYQVSFCYKRCMVERRLAEAMPSSMTHLRGLGGHAKVYNLGMSCTQVPALRVESTAGARASIGRMKCSVNSAGLTANGPLQAPT